MSVIPYIIEQDDEFITVLNCQYVDSNIMQLIIKKEMYNQQVVIFAKFFSYKNNANEDILKLVYVSRRNEGADRWIVVEDEESVYHQIIVDTISNTAFYEGCKLWEDVIKGITFGFGKHNVKYDTMINENVFTYITQLITKLKEKDKEDILNILKEVLTLNFDLFTNISENVVFYKRKKIQNNLENLKTNVFSTYENMFNEIYDTLKNDFMIDNEK